MAQAKHSEAPADSTPAGIKKKPVLILAMVAVLALTVGGGAAWFFLGKKSGHEVAKPKPAAPPVFLTLEPFVVNLSGDVQHFLQVGIDLRVADGNVSDQIKVHLPEIRNSVLLLLSSKSVEDLATIEQKNQLRAEIREAVNKPIGVVSAATKPPATPEPQEGGAGEAHAAEAPPAEVSAPAKESEKPAGVLEVLLTSFVIQ
jgi:flagellar FliL protein